MWERKPTPNVVVLLLTHRRPRGNWLGCGCTDLPDGKLRLMSWRSQLRVSVHEHPGRGFPFCERHGSAHRNTGLSL